MSETITLSKDDTGKIFITENQSVEVVNEYNTDELRRQIKMHSDFICDLQLKLQTVEKFEKSDKTQAEQKVETKIANPIIDTAALDTVTYIEPPAEPETVDDSIADDVAGEKSDSEK